MLASWGTPTVQDAKHATVSPSEMDRDPANLRLQAHLAGWPTPSTSAAGPCYLEDAISSHRGHPLATFAELARLTDSGGTPRGYLLGPNGWETHPASGQLNPSLSRFLMSLPAIFDLCAIQAHANVKSRRRKE